MPRWTKPVGGHDVLSSFVTGILILGGLFMWLLTTIPWFVTLAVFLMGLLNLLDDMFPYGRQPFIVTYIGGFSVGCFTLVILNAFGFMLWLITASALIFLLRQSIKLVNRHSK